MNEKVQSLINAAGALAEVSKITYDNFVRTGFTQVQALSLTQTVLSVQMLISAMCPPQGEGKE